MPSPVFAPAAAAARALSACCHAWRALHHGAPPDVELPFEMQWRQFLVRPALTINKAQGQTLSKADVFLPTWRQRPWRAPSPYGEGALHCLH